MGDPFHKFLPIIGHGLSAETVSSRMVWSFPSPQTQPASKSPRKSRGKRPLEDGPKCALNLHHKYAYADTH